MPITISHEKYEAFKNLTDQKDYLEISLSTDRNDESETLERLIEFTERAKDCCRVLGIDYKSLPPLSYDFDNSDHETVTKRLYFWPHEPKVGAQIHHKHYGDGIIQSIYSKNELMTVKFSNGQEEHVSAFSSSYTINELIIEY